MTGEGEMAAQRQGYGRLDAPFLVSHVPEQMPLLTAAAWTSSVAISVFLLTVFFAILAWIWQPLLVLLAPAVYFTFRQWPSIIEASSDSLNDFWLRKRWETANTLTARRGYTTNAGGTVPGRWVCHGKDYEHTKAIHRASFGPSDGPPDATYNLLVATVRKSGNEQLLSFSDGSVRVWNPRAQVFELETPIPDYPVRADRPQELFNEAATVLEAVIRLLYGASDGRLSIEDFSVSLSNYYSWDAFIRCLTVAEWWGLIEADHVDMEGSLKAPDTSSGPTIIITEAGRVWHEASETIQRQFQRTGKGSNVKERGGSSPSFHIGGDFTGVIQVAKGDIKGRSKYSVSARKANDEEFLSALAEVLTLREIPWNTPSLEEVRQVIQDAIAERDPHKPRMKWAISKLFQVCEGLAVGVTGNAIFDTLRGCLGS
jgi:hypothetical protein